MVLYSHPIATSCGYCNVIGLLWINMPWYDWILDVGDKWSQLQGGCPLQFLQLWILSWLVVVHGAKCHFYLSDVLDFWFPRKVTTCTGLHTSLNCCNIGGQMGIGSLESWMLLYRVLVVVLGFQNICLKSKSGKLCTLWWCCIVTLLQPHVAIAM